jgi:hypothetical protein
LQRLHQPTARKCAEWSLWPINFVRLDESFFVLHFWALE